jgi:putative SOS response-associated peptidase YedK
MCGRFVVAGAATDLVTLFDVDLVGEDLPAPSWNVAPTDRVSIVLDSLPKPADADSEPIRRLEAARWGLVPGWAKDSKGAATAINARIETAAEKPHFRTAVKKRRAIVPVSGYYEWRTVDGVKTPHFIHLPDDQLTVFAGLYEWWRDPAAADDAHDNWLLSTSILTRQAEGELASIHDRMPVFLSADLADEWLDPYTDGTRELLDLVSTGSLAVAEAMTFYEVDRAVGNVKNNGPQLIEPISL